MEPERSLAVLNGRVLREYSRRTTAALRAALPLRLALPHIEPTLALNVAKEMRKDSLVVRRAAQVVAAGRAPGRDDLQQLYEASKQIDGEFLAQVGAFPVGIVLRYEELAPVRLMRIELLLGSCCMVLQAWRRTARDALRDAFVRDDFERRLLELLRLYAEETHLLSHAVRLPKLLVPAREQIAQKLLQTMGEAAGGLAGDLARLVWRAA